MKKFLMFFLFFLVFGPSIVEAEETDLAIVSEAAILVDSQSGATLYEKNSEQKMYPASLTKIATAIYAIEKGNLEDEVTVSKNAIEVEGTRVYLNEGEVVPLRKLIQGMLINSGNDAAVAVAEHLDGSVEKFSERINKYLANEIGVEHTHFMNPHGLFAENHYTTARDLALITNYAMKNPEFKEIFGTKLLPWHGESWDTTIVSHHLFLKGELPYEEEITGGKTGFVNESKHTLATTAAKENTHLTAIVLKANYKNEIYHDTEKLLDYGFEHYRTTIIPKGSKFEKNDRKFVLKNDAVVTEDIRGTSVTVTKTGELQIKKSDEATIQTVHLEPVVKKTPSKKEENNDDSGILSMNAVFLLAGIAIATGFFLKRKARSNHY